MARRVSFWDRFEGTTSAFDRRFSKFDAKIPVYRNAPLLSPGNEKQWPLVLFSHGLGGSRTAYSQLCTEMAAAGKVVLAIEHRDGTAPACTFGSRTVLYYRDEDVV